jgi:NAD(P) transhydrogenase subunit alpha
VFKVGVPTPATKSACCAQGGTLIGFVWPAQNPELMQQLAGEKGHRTGH